MKKGRKKEKMKKNEIIKDKQEQNLKNEVNNLDEFFERVKEKSDFQKLFNSDNKNFYSQQPAIFTNNIKNDNVLNLNLSSNNQNEKIILQENDFVGDLLIFENKNSEATQKEKISTIDEKNNRDLLSCNDLFNHNNLQNSPNQIDVPQNKEPRLIEFKKDTLIMAPIREEEKNEHSDDYDSEENHNSRIENKMKNNSIFTQTPLSKCISTDSRKNTLTNKNINNSSFLIKIK